MKYLGLLLLSLCAVEALILLAVRFPAVLLVVCSVFSGLVVGGVGRAYRRQYTERRTR